MAYTVRCPYCNHRFYDVSKHCIEETIVEHEADKHSDMPVKFTLVRISAEEYKAYLENKDNPRFWQTIRLVRKLCKLPTFV